VCSARNEYLILRIMPSHRVNDRSDVILCRSDGSPHATAPGPDEKGTWETLGP
jgi:hypothetical protein